MEESKKLVEQANLALQQGRYEQALQQYRRALALMPNHPGILNNYAAALEKLNRLDEALVTYELAQAQIPPHPGIMNNRGLVLMKLHRLDEALANLTVRYGSILSTRKLSTIAATSCSDFGGWKKPSIANDRANAIRPRHVKTHNNRTVVLQELKRYGEASSGSARC